MTPCWSCGATEGLRELPPYLDDTGKVIMAGAAECVDTPGCVARRREQRKAAR